MMSRRPAVPPVRTRWPCMQDVTPAAVGRALAEGAPLRAALLALRLKDGALLRHALLSTPPSQVQNCPKFGRAALTDPKPGTEHHLTLFRSLCVILFIALRWVRPTCGLPSAPGFGRPTKGCYTAAPCCLTAAMLCANECGDTFCCVVSKSSRKVNGSTLGLGFTIASACHRWMQWCGGCC